MIYRKPLPVNTIQFYEGVMIDDHLGVMLLSWKGSLQQTLLQPGRDQDAFSMARAAYLHADLEVHPKKAKRREVRTKVWGAEVESLPRLVGPVRSR